LEALGGWSGFHADDNGHFQAGELINFIRIDVPRQIKQHKLDSKQKPFGGPLKGNPQGTEFNFLPHAPRLSRELVGPLANQNVQIRRTAISQLGQVVDPNLQTAKFLALARMARDSSPSVRQDVIAELRRLVAKRRLSKFYNLFEMPTKQWPLLRLELSAKLVVVIQMRFAS
jgi:hypothetical protein